MDESPTILFTIIGGHGYPTSCQKLVDGEWVRAKREDHRAGIRYLRYLNKDSVPVWSNEENGEEKFETYSSARVGQPPTPEEALRIYHLFKEKVPWNNSMFQELAFIYSFVSDDEYY